MTNEDLPRVGNQESISPAEIKNLIRFCTVKDADVRKQTITEVRHLVEESSDVFIAGETRAVIENNLVGTLGYCLEDDESEVRECALEALWGIGENDLSLIRDKIKDITERLNDKDGDVRRTAVKVLGNIGKQDSALVADELNLLIQAMDDDKTFLSAIHSLEQIAKQDQTIVGEAIEDLPSVFEQHAVTASSIETIEVNDDSKAAIVVPVLAVLLRDDNPEIKKEAARSLSQIADRDPLLVSTAVEAMIDELPLTDFVLEQIGRHDPEIIEEHVDSLVSQLDDLPQYGQESVVDVFKRSYFVDPDATINAIEQALPLLEVDNSTVQKNAADLIGNLGWRHGPQAAEAVEPLIKTLSISDDKVRIEAATTLGLIAFGEMEPLRETVQLREEELLTQTASALIDSLGDPEDDVRYAASRAIGFSPSMYFVEYFDELCDSIEDDTLSRRYLADTLLEFAENLEEIGPKNLSKLVTSFQFLLDSKSCKKIGIEGFEKVARHDPLLLVENMEEVATKLQDEEPVVRAWAARTIGHIAKAEQADKDEVEALLCDVLENDKNSLVQASAARALTTLDDASLTTVSQTFENSLEILAESSDYSEIIRNSILFRPVGSNCECTPVDKELFSVLENKIQNGSASVQQAALEYISSIESVDGISSQVMIREFRDLLIIGLEANDTEIRARSIELLGRIGIHSPTLVKDVLSDIETHIESDDEKILRAAIQAIGYIGKKRPDIVIHLISKVVPQLNNDAIDIRRDAKIALGRIAGDKTLCYHKDTHLFYLPTVLEREEQQAHPLVAADIVEPLADIVYEGDHAGARWYAVEALGIIGREEPTQVSDVTDVIAAALDDEHIRVRRNASRALGRIGATNPTALDGEIDALGEVLQDLQPPVRQTAADSLSRIQEVESTAIPHTIKQQL